ncbi:MAG: cysteine desulfurase [Deltaproteobacteria bacterium]|nr:cysteine desulfurase [Deltaproteobacteria bacterium]
MKSSNTAFVRSPLFDLRRIREEFPILKQKIRGKPLVYLDNAATAQKPQAVIETLHQFYSVDNSNIHRGVHLLSERATEAYEEARAKIQLFINAGQSSQIIFTRGATEAINLVAQSYGRKNFQSGDEVLITAMEHHSNIVPWQIVCEATGAKLKVLPINDQGELLPGQLDKLLTKKTRLVSVTQMSNVLGTINPVKEIIRRCHQQGTPVLVDGAQAIAHLKIDVQDLDCDFYVFSGHKLYGPTGIGVLYGKARLLEEMPPYQGGGDMIRTVTFEKTTYNTLPYKFEAGTPHIAGAVGLGAAIQFISEIDFEAATKHEMDLLRYAELALRKIPALQLIGTAQEKASVISFTMEGIHPHDIGTILDQEGIAIRTGHHCAQPLMDRLGVVATARVSLAFYNTKEEIDLFIKGLKKVREVFG